MARAEGIVSEISHAVPDSDGTRPKRANGPAMLAWHCETHGLSMAEAARHAIKEYLQDQPDYVAPY